MTNAADTTAEKKDKKQHKRPTPKQWAEAEALWAAGDVTQPQLAAKLGVSEQAVHKHMQAKGIKKGEKAEEHKKKVSEEVTKAAIDEATITAARIRETKEEHYKMSAGMAKLAWSEIMLAKQNRAPVASVMNNIKALDAAMNVLSKARQERWAVLGLDRPDAIDEDGLPELLISELTAEQIEDLRNRDFNEFEDVETDPEIDPENEVVEEGAG